MLFGRRVKNPSPRNVLCYGTDTKTSELKKNFFRQTSGGSGIKIEMDGNVEGSRPIKGFEFCYHIVRYIVS
jgi:hypothetical protein